MVNSFKFCMVELKLQTATGTSIEQNGSDRLPARLGLIDLGDGTHVVNWGNVNIPNWAVVKTLHVEIQMDQSSCGGAAYSASVNGRLLTVSLEYNFAFSNPTTLNSGQRVNLALTNLINAFSQALQAGQLDDQHIGNYLNPSVQDIAD